MCCFFFFLGFFSANPRRSTCCDQNHQNGDKTLLCDRAIVKKCVCIWFLGFDFLFEVDFVFEEGLSGDVFARFLKRLLYTVYKQIQVGLLFWSMFFVSQWSFLGQRSRFGSQEAFEDSVRTEVLETLTSELQHGVFTRSSDVCFFYFLGGLNDLYFFWAGFPSKNDEENTKKWFIIRETDYISKYFMSFTCLDST